MSQYQLIRQFKRTHGSIGQQLVEIGTTFDGQVYDDTTFYVLRREGILYFGKRPHCRDKLDAEVTLLRAADHPHVLHVLEVHKEYGMISLFFSGIPLSGVDLRSVDNAQEWLEEVLELAVFLERKMILEVIDIHANNVLCAIEENAIRDWMLVDFERCEWAANRTRCFINALRTSICRWTRA